MEETLEAIYSKSLSSKNTITQNLFYFEITLELPKSCKNIPSSQWPSPCCITRVQICNQGIHTDVILLGNLQILFKRCHFPFFWSGIQPRIPTKLSCQVSLVSFKLWQILQFCLSWTLILLASPDQLFCRILLNEGLSDVFSLEWGYTFLARIPKKWCLLSAR